MSSIERVNEICAAIVARLEARGVRAVNLSMGFPMEMYQTPGHVIWVVSHKPVAVEAGLGHMGIHRNLIHPRFGNFVLLGTVLMEREASDYDHPIDYNPCLECKLCVAACPVGAIGPDGSFNFSSCFTHNYREFLGGFSDWIEQVADARDAMDYRRRISEPETASMWQSLSHGANYKSAYCMAVCPAAEDVIGPSMVLVLRHLYEDPPPGVYEPQFVGMVLERLFEVAPAEGRALIMKEMIRPRPRFDLRFVHLLPDKEIPELDGPLVESLEASKGQESTIVELIARYATPGVFARVMAIEADQLGQMPCEAQAALLAYAFRSDPASGAELLSKALAARKATRCYTTVLGEVAARGQMTPEIEQEAVAHLDDPDVEVVASAVTTLGRYGSAEAEQPLWDRLRKWHSAWASRSSELPDGYGPGLKNGLETGLELALVEALGTGQGWFAGPERLGKLASLCVSAGGCRKAQELITQYSATPVITVFPASEGHYSGMVNQYQLDSLDSLHQKLIQFPKGTVFEWAFTDDAKDGAPILAQIQAFLAEHGMTIR